MFISILLCIFFLIFQQQGHALTNTLSSSTTTPVKIYKNLDTLGKGLCFDLIKCCKNEIESKGSFTVAVPGGSVLKMLQGLKDFKNDVDWSKVILFYVNHKCDTSSSATHIKAKSLFLDHLSTIQVFPLKLSTAGTNFADNAIIQASLYTTALQTYLPKNTAGVPTFDYMLLGVGKDGHIGSLYPGRNEVLQNDAWVLPVDKKTPNSITLTLPVINAAKHIRIVMSGEDKIAAVGAGILKTLTPSEFPVCGVQGRNIEWLIDESCATEIKSKTTCIDADASPSAASSNE